MKYLRALLIFILLSPIDCISQPKPRLMTSLGYEEYWKTWFSPDGKLVVSGGVLWNVVSGKVLYRAISGIDEIDPSCKIVLKRVDSTTLEAFDLRTEKHLYTVTGHTRLINEIGFSPDVNTFVTSSNDGVIKFWDLQTGALLRTADHGNPWTVKLVYNSTGEYLLTYGYDKTRLWDTRSGLLLQEFKLTTYGAFDKRGERLALASKDGDSISVYDTKSFNLIKRLYAPGFSIGGNERITFSAQDDYLLKHTNHFNDYSRLSLRSGEPQEVRWYSPDTSFYVFSNKFGELELWEGNHRKASLSYQNYYSISADSKIIFTRKGYDSLYLWSRHGQLLHRWGLNCPIYDVITGPDGTSVLLIGDKEQKVFNLSVGNQLGKLVNAGYNRCTFSPRGKFLLMIHNENSVEILNAKTGGVVSAIQPQGIYRWSFSPDERTILTFSKDRKARLCSTATGKVIWEWQPPPGELSIATFSKKGTMIMVRYSGTTMVLDATSGQVIQSGNFENIFVPLEILSPDGRFYFGNSDETSATEESYIYSTHSNGASDSLFYSEKNGDKVLFTLSGYNVKFSLTGDTISTNAGIDHVYLWTAKDGKSLTTIPVRGVIQDINLDQMLALSRFNSMFVLTDLRSGKEIISFDRPSGSDWVVTHSSGLFDASPGAEGKLYFVQGVDVIEFNQLKSRYYEPGLWSKAMTGDKLREAVSFKSIDLPPEIRVGQVDQEGYLPIELTNRGGGIGEVSIQIFGKEIVKDARDQKTNADAPRMTLKYYIANHKNLVEGIDNLISVKAWNKDHWVQSRGELVSYRKTGTVSHKPAIYILSCGISDYTGNEIDLRFASKDAEDMSNALKAGATKLFGVSQSYIYKFTTSGSKENWPTKKNILKGFETIAKKAHPLDVIVVYLSGHGINVGGQDGDWRYLTQDAYTASSGAYNDPAILEQTTISSGDLVELFKKIPAAKQVLMIDACASGKVVENLMAKKDIESSAIRALDRMKDRTGMHIITGCAADAVSYEASRYGQGVLTYSLLEGMRGAALREEQFVDVNKLFQYAEERVPVLATSIGGIQSPMIFSPNGSQSFDFGQLGAEEKRDVPIAKIRPVFIRSNFQDENELEDVMDLGKKVDESLNELAAGGTDAPIIFVDVREYPDGCKLVGRYLNKEGKILVKLKKRCEGRDITAEVTGANAKEVVRQIVKVAMGL